jgi:hypothetical protein
MFQVKCFGIRPFVSFGIENPESGIRNPGSGIPNLGSVIQNPTTSSIASPGAILKIA